MMAPDDAACFSWCPEEKETFGRRFPRAGPKVGDARSTVELRDVNEHAPERT